MIATHNGELVDGAWLQARLGKLTASRMADAMSFTKAGKETAKRRKLKLDVLAERMTDVLATHHVTAAMEHGKEFEEDAKQAYVAHTERMIIDGTNCFVEHPTIEFFGATPDAFIGNDGLLETKCPTTKTHIIWSLAGVVPPEHMPQMAAQLLCTQRKWVDFASYDPRMPQGRRLFTLRFIPTKEYLLEVEAAAIQFLKEVDELFEHVTSTPMA